MPQQLVITGGQALNGEVTISGAKNSALKLICAALLTEEPVTLTNMPDLKDVETLCALLTFMGAACKREGDSLTIQATNIGVRAPYELVSKMRASILVLGPLLARFGRAEVAMPGGCAIGDRPLDITQHGFEQMGARFILEHGMMWVKGKLKGVQIHLRLPSVGATENLMLGATLAEGTTVIENAACEPEMVDLANLLNAMGAKVKGAGTSRIEIEGVQKLHGATQAVMADRIEAGSYLVAALLAGGDKGVTVRRSPNFALKTFFEMLRATGAKFEEIDENTLFVPAQSRHFTAVELMTDYYPGVATDLQAQTMLFATQCDGISKIYEKIYENRMMHAAELRNMNASIEVINPQLALVHGKTKLSGAHVKCTDLRGGMAVVLAGLVADGYTVVHDLHHLDRGYEKLEQKLSALGAKIKREEIEAVA